MVGARARRGRERPAPPRRSRPLDRFARMDVGVVGAARRRRRDEHSAVASDAGHDRLRAVSSVPPIRPTFVPDCPTCPRASHASRRRRARALAVRSRRRSSRRTRSTRRAVRPTKKCDAPPITSVSVFVHAAVAACTSPAGRNSSCSASSDAACGRGSAPVASASSSQRSGSAIAHQPACPSSRIERARSAPNDQPTRYVGTRRVERTQVRRARPGRRGARRSPSSKRPLLAPTPRKSNRRHVDARRGRAPGTARRSRAIASSRRTAGADGTARPARAARCGGRQLGVEGLAVVGDQRHALRPWRVEPKVRDPCPPASTTRPRSDPLGDGRYVGDDGRVVVGAPRPERRLPRRGDPPRARRDAVDDPARSPRSLTVHYANPAGAGDVEIATTPRTGRPVDDDVLGARSSRTASSIALALAAFSAPRAGHRVLRPRDAAGPRSAATTWPAPVPAESPPIAHRWETRWAIGHPPVPGMPRGCPGGRRRVDPAARGSRGRRVRGRRDHRRLDPADVQPRRGAGVRPDRRPHDPLPGRAAASRARRRRVRPGRRSARRSPPAASSRRTARCGRPTARCSRSPASSRRSSRSADRAQPAPSRFE